MEYAHTSLFAGRQPSLHILYMESFLWPLRMVQICYGAHLCICLGTVTLRLAAYAHKLQIDVLDSCLSSAMLSALARTALLSHSIRAVSPTHTAVN